MDSKIELFNIILERTELCRQSFNAMSQLRYATRKYLVDKWTIEQFNDKAIKAKIAKDRVKAFTKKTTTRRRQLAHQLNTKQIKSASNTISAVNVNGKHYTKSDMKKAIDEHVAEQILLGVKWCTWVLADMAALGKK